MGDETLGGPTGVSLEPNTLASSNPYFKRLFHVKISNFFNTFTVVIRSTGHAALPFTELRLVTLQMDY